MAEFSSYPPGTPSWVELATTDLQGAKDFYRAIFGWSYEDEPAGEESASTMCLLRGKPVAALFQMGPEQREAGTPPHWITYITVASADEAAAMATDAGGTILLPAFDVEDAGRMTIVRDAAGAFISFWEPRKHFGAMLANEPGTRTWNELQVHDVDAAKNFYAAVLGVTTHTEEMPDGPYTTFNLAGRPVAGLMQIKEQWGSVPPHWDVYFAVADTDETLEKAVAAGGTVDVAARDIPDVGRFAGITDPQGAMFFVLAGF